MMKRSSPRENNLKKSKLIFIFILSVLLLSPSVSSSSVGVGPVHDVEVKAGESYNWLLKINISNYKKLLTNTGGPISTELLALDLSADADGIITLTAKLEILFIPDDFVIDSFFDLTFTIVEGEFTLAPDYNISTIPIFFPLNFSIKPTLTETNFSILKGDTTNYFTAHKGNAYPKGTYHGFFFIIPTDLDWTTAAAELQTEILSYFRNNYGITEGSVLPQNNGLKVTIPSDTTILATELNLNYNSKGVLETASGKYGGIILFSLELASDGTIAFELPFLLSVFTIAIVILIIRKRKNNAIKIDKIKST
ncbi:hypothetical protein LCGC14_2693560 [marine sediment metagenome]|uniref:Uncharacterized protein n=1 Tax=marine sediment metagenome TaxID=412755 RepID=A0A0F9BSF1_9ZZZZ